MKYFKNNGGGHAKDRMILTFASSHRQALFRAIMWRSGRDFCLPWGRDELCSEPRTGGGISSEGAGLERGGGWEIRERIG